MFDFLRKIPLFADLPDEDLKHLCRLVEEVRISAGEELFAEGSPGDRAYVIRSGELEILKRSGGREVLLAVRKGGEVIGEMALQEESPRTATVRARTDGVLLAIDKEQLDRLLSNSVSGCKGHVLHQPPPAARDRGHASPERENGAAWHPHSRGGPRAQ